MSLIEEALRKQREEVEHAEKSPTPPPIPAEMTAEPPEEEQVPAARRPWIMLAGIVLLGILGIAFILWLLFFGLHLWQKEQPPAATPKAVATATNVQAKTPPAPPQPPPPTGIAVTSTPPVSTTATNVAPPATPPAAPAPAPAPAVRAAEPAAPPKPVEPPAPEAVKPAPVVAQAPTGTPAKVALPVIWPKLVVTGLIGSSKTGHSAAIVNGQMLSPGDSIEGVKIESVEKQRVKLAFQGETKLLSVGGSTE